ncbi:MAG: hypothetical protein K2G05_07025, partial [Duncaniella sp.]|nr:hypothetical protein [Duncaniella sp.]
RHFVSSRLGEAFRLSAHALRRSCRGYDYPASSRLRRGILYLRDSARHFVSLRLGEIFCLWLVPEAR